MKKLILICLSTCFFLATSAQEKTMQLSLQEAINFALENSYNAKAAKNDIKSAKEIENTIVKQENNNKIIELDLKQFNTFFVFN